VATINNGKIDLRKDTAKVDSVAAKHSIVEMRGQPGITQLRWAHLASHHKSIHNRIWIQTVTWLAGTMATW
jgi:hypothetical protein